jgi:hypothetical protein
MHLPTGLLQTERQTIVNSEALFHRRRHIGMQVSRVMLRVLGAGFFVPLCAVGAQRSAGTIPVVALGPNPEAVASESFRGLRGVRGIDEGRVLVNDVTGRQLLVLDPQLRREVTLLGQGLGANAPYPRSGAQLVRAGDSTLFIDLDSRSLVLIDPRGTIVRTLAPPRVNDLPQIGNGPVASAGTDAFGRLVYRIVPARVAQVAPSGPQRAPTSSGPAGLDSALLVRADWVTRALDTIASVAVETVPAPVPGPTLQGRPTSRVRINPAVPMIDEWAVLSDGAVAVVRGADYRIELIEADGRRSTAKLPIAWRPVTEAEKRARLDSARRVLDSLATTARPFGMMVTHYADRPKPDTLIPTVEFADPSAMPDYVAPIRRGAVLADADNNVWILPTTSDVGARGLVYDVVSRQGEIVVRVRFPEGGTVAGFGRGGVLFLTERLPDGSHSIERWRLPTQ